jgi:hypothetical protein
MYNVVSPSLVHTSAVVKSMAAMESQCALRNVFQVVVHCRFGAGCPEDIPDGGVGDLVPEVSERSLDRVGRDDGRRLHQSPATEGLCLDGQNPSLVVGEEGALAAHLVHDDPNLGVLELEDLLLPAVHQSG